MRNRRSTAAILETPRLEVPHTDVGFVDASRLRTLEDRVSAAVLDDAVLSWRRVATARGPRSARLRRELHGWFASDTTGGPFTFVNVCERLGLERAGVRARLGLTDVADEAA